MKYLTIILSLFLCSCQGGDTGSSGSAYPYMAGLVHISNAPADVELISAKIEDMKYHLHSDELSIFLDIDSTKKILRVWANPWSGYLHVGSTIKVFKADNTVGYAIDSRSLNMYPSNGESK